jgi:hypothetical protein
MDVKCLARGGIDPFAVDVALCLEEGGIFKLYRALATVRPRYIQRVLTEGTFPPAMAYDLDIILKTFCGCMLYVRTGVLALTERSMEAMTGYYILSGPKRDVREGRPANRIRDCDAMGFFLVRIELRNPGDATA